MTAATEEERTELEHQFLDHAKAFEWDSVKSMLDETPDLINVQPAGRWTALHQAAYEGNKGIAEFLVSKGSKLEALTHARKTPLQVAKGGVVEYLRGLGESAARTEAPQGDAPEEEGATPAEEAAPAERAEGVAPEKGAAPAEDAPPAEEAPPALPEEALAIPPKKKAKVAKSYSLNINCAVDKEFEGSSLRAIAAAPTSALQGIGEKSRGVLKKLGVKTVRDLGAWKYYRIAKAIVGLAALEAAGEREEGAGMNINKALIKKHEKDSLQEMVKLPPSALQGLAQWTDAELASLHIKSVAALGEWKFARWAEWISELAEFETEDFSS